MTQTDLEAPGVETHSPRLRLVRALDAAGLAVGCALAAYLWEMLAMLPVLLVLTGVPIPVWGMLVTIPPVLIGFFWWEIGRFGPETRQRRRATLRLGPPNGGWGWIAGGLLLATAFSATLVMIVFRISPPPEADESWIAKILDQPQGWVPLFLLAVVIAPLVEEVLMRGRLQKELEERWGPAVAIVATALIFAVIHFSVWEFPVLVIAGLLLGAMAWLTGSVWPAIALHALYNGVEPAIISAVVNAWEDALFRPVGLLVLVLVALGLGYLLLRLGRHYHTTFHERAQAIVPP